MLDNYHNYLSKWSIVGILTYINTHILTHTHIHRTDTHTHTHIHRTDTHTYTHTPDKYTHIHTYTGHIDTHTHTHTQILATVIRIGAHYGRVSG